MTRTSNVIRSRDGRPIEPGMRVRMQGCTGPYGQTAIEEGVIERLYPALSAVLLRTASGPRTVGVELSGHRRFDDFEHGHEVWTEIVEG